MKTKSELQKRHLAILVELDKIDETANAREEGKRALTLEEQEKWDALVREDKQIGLTLRGMIDDAQLQKELRENRDRNVMFREYIQAVKEKRTSNTVTLAPKTTPDGTSIKESGAVALTIKDLIDTKVEGINLPANLNMLTGVVGDVLWPLAGYDAVASVAGEVSQID